MKIGTDSFNNSKIRTISSQAPKYQWYMEKVQRLRFYQSVESSDSKWGTTYSFR